MTLRPAALALALLASGCVVTGGAHAKQPRAYVVLEARAGSTLTGEASFERRDGNWIQFRIEVRNVTPGVHATHIHEHGDCSAPDAKSAGGHWNPTSKKHGKWGQDDGEFHLGDLGNIEVGADGTGTLTITTDQWTMGDGGPADIVGKSIIVHAMPDDFTSQPTGNAGDRIGCGVIVLQSNW